MKNKFKDLDKRKKIFWCLTIVWMAVIFIFSSKDADTSTAESHEVGKFIGYMTEYDFPQWTPDAQERYAEKIDHPIRKTAHFLEYMLLGSLITYAWFDPELKKVKLILVPLLTGILYSITDELHQILVAGRAGLITDILIDTAGVIVGILIALGIIHLLKKFWDAL